MIYPSSYQEPTRQGPWKNQRRGRQWQNSMLPSSPRRKGCKTSSTTPWIKRNLNVILVSIVHLSRSRQHNRNQVFLITILIFQSKRQVQEFFREIRIRPPCDVIQPRNVVAESVRPGAWGALRKALGFCHKLFTTWQHERDNIRWRSWISHNQCHTRSEIGLLWVACTLDCFVVVRLRCVKLINKHQDEAAANRQPLCNHVYNKVNALCVYPARENQKEEKTEGKEEALN